MNHTCQIITPSLCCGSRTTACAAALILISNSLLSTPDMYSGTSDSGHSEERTTFIERTNCLLPTDRSMHSVIGASLSEPHTGGTVLRYPPVRTIHVQSVLSNSPPVGKAFQGQLLGRMDY